MAKYDAAGDKIRRKIPVSLITLIVGVVILVIGIILCNVMNMKQYFNQETIDETFESANIQKLDIDYGAGELTIERSSDDKIHVTGKAMSDYLSASTDDDCFRLTTKQITFFDSWKHFGFGDTENNKLTIYLPEKTYDEAKVDIGAGQTIVNDLNCIKGDFIFGAGAVTINSSVFSDEADFDCGAGQIVFNDCTVGAANFDCGVGQLDFNGVITDDTDIDCGVGECNFYLQGNESDYKLRGDMTNGTDNSDAIKIKVSKGVGDVNFRFN